MFLGGLPCLVALVQGGTLISFSSEGEPVPVLLKRMSTEAAQQFTCAPFFARDVLVVRFEKTAPEEVRKEIAAATLGKWEQTNTGWNLVRDNEAERVDEKAEFAKCVKFFSQAIDKKRQAAAKLEPFDSSSAKKIALMMEDMAKEQRSNSTNRFDSAYWQRQRALNNRAPGGRALVRFTASLSAADVAALPDDYRVVFSSQPNRMQRALSKEQMAFVSDLVKEQNTWADVAETAAPDTEGPVMVDALYRKDRIDKKIDKVIVAMTKSTGYGYSLNCEVQVADAKGKVLFQSSDYLSAFDDETMQGPDTNPALADSADPLEPNEVGKKLIDIMLNSRGRTGPPKLSKDILDSFLYPEKTDPLALMTGGLLLQGAKQRGKNLVANIPDVAAFAPAYTSNSTVTMKKLLKALEMTRVTVIEDDHTILALPGSVMKNRENRADRAALGKYLRRISGEGRKSLDAAAEYALSTAGDGRQDLGMMLEQLVLNSGSEPFEYTDPTMLKFYGSLNSNQKAQIKSNQKISISQLTQPQVDLLYKIVYGGYPNLQMQPELQTAENSWEEFYNSLQREPTEAMPNGFPADTVLTVTDNTNKIVMLNPVESQTDGMYYGGMGMDENSMAQYLLAKERPEIMPWYDKYPSVEDAKFSYKQQRSIQFDFDFGKRARYSSSLSESTPLITGKVGFKDLPQEFRDKVEKALVALRKQYEGVKPGDFGDPIQGGATPPPPPRR